MMRMTKTFMGFSEVGLKPEYQTPNSLRKNLAAKPAKLGNLG